MKVEIWSIGKNSDKFIEEGIRYYLKKLKPLCQVEFILIPPPKRSTAMTVDQMKAMEAKMISDKVQPHHYLILLDERGQSLTSKQWAQQLEFLRNNNVKTLVFLIGGPWGVSADIFSAAKQVWALSPLTFPHQLVRLIMAEQIYRSFSIINHSAYHHD